MSTKEKTSIRESDELGMKTTERKECKVYRKQRPAYIYYLIELKLHLI